MEENANREMDEVLSRAKASMEETVKVRTKLESVSKEKLKSEKKVTELSSKLTKTSTELKEERQMNESLRQNQTDWQNKMQRTERKVKDISSEKDQQIKDLQVGSKARINTWFTTLFMIAGTSERFDVLP